VLLSQGSHAHNDLQAQVQDTDQAVHIATFRPSFVELERWRSGVRASTIYQRIQRASTIYIFSTSGPENYIAPPDLKTNCSQNYIIVHMASFDCTSTLAMSALRQRMRDMLFRGRSAPSPLARNLKRSLEPTSAFSSVLWEQWQ
jgi:hypothetical protein